MASKTSFGDVLALLVLCAVLPISSVKSSGEKMNTKMFLFILLIIATFIGGLKCYTMFDVYLGSFFMIASLVGAVVLFGSKA